MTRQSVIIWGYVIALIALILDQVTKYIIIHILHLDEVGRMDIAPLLSLDWVENRGVSMGLFPANSMTECYLLITLTLIIASIVCVWIWRERNLDSAIALGMILGGAIGNIADRIRYGYVVDFIYLHWKTWGFYVFNVADAAISLGVVFLLFRFPGRPASGSDGTQE